MSKRTAALVLATLALAVLTAWFYSAPQRTLKAIRDAASAGDAERLADLVDFPAVRESLKEQLRASVGQELQRTAASQDDNPFAAAGAALGAMIADRLIDSSVDSFVSPAGLASLSRGNKPALPARASAPHASQTEAPIVRRGFESLSHYSVTFRDASDAASPISLHLRRSGLTWRLSSIRLEPPDGASANTRPLVDDADAQLQTMRRMRDIGTALMSLVTDQLSAGAAGQGVASLSDYRLKTSAELEKELVPGYLTELPTTDGWGNSFEFYFNSNDLTGAYVALIRSPGRDGRFEGAYYPLEPFRAPGYDNDIVWADGFFIRYPKG